MCPVKSLKLSVPCHLLLLHITDAIKQRMSKKLMQLIFYCCLRNAIFPRYYLLSRLSLNEQLIFQWLGFQIFRNITQQCIFCQIFFLIYFIHWYVFMCRICENDFSQERNERKSYQEEVIHGLNIKENYSKLATYSFSFRI